MSIEVAKLTKRYGSQKALNNITFKTKENSVVGFLGPNGAGKSTTMKILAGVLQANEGTYSVRGIDIHQEPITAKKIIGYLPEDNPLYLDMYVLEILSFEADIHKIKNKAQRIREVVAETGLETEQHKKVRELSKGFKQRLGLALAILHDPKVLILDEPTSGLDPNQILEIRSLIKSLGSHKTVLISTHLLQEVEAICDEIIIIDQGEIRVHFDFQEMKNLYPDKSLEDIFVKYTL
ncbi:ATP-binding cassette domain-containing protein [Sphingobacterium sp. LRF_L2]|uniref:ATP-binding cassette domain-containing protein n=1 Tax=Sphingobacterium sp. LRF_L2 TaxID=3369421 RepID=UPI003F60343B